MGSRVAVACGTVVGKMLGKEDCGVHVGKICAIAVGGTNTGNGVFVGWFGGTVGKKFTTGGANGGACVAVGLFPPAVDPVVGVGLFPTAGGTIAVAVAVGHGVGDGQGVGVGHPPAGGVPVGGTHVGATHVGVLVGRIGVTDGLAGGVAVAVG